ncbi:hypothetical protein H1R20_g4574, partial [Candolleomyces eurysporus]
MSKPFQQQDTLLVKKFVSMILEKYPELHQYVDGWPVVVIIKRFLRSCKDYKTKQKGETASSSMHTSSQSKKRAHHTGPEDDEPPSKRYRVLQTLHALDPSPDSEYGPESGFDPSSFYELESKSHDEDSLYGHHHRLHVNPDAVLPLVVANASADIYTSFRNGLTNSRTTPHRYLVLAAV